MIAWVPDQQGLELLGTPPTGVQVEVADPRHRPASGDQVRFVVAPPADAAVVAAVAALPRLEVVQLLSAGADAWVGQLPDRVTLCDARGVHGSSTSEWVLAATLAAVRELPRFVHAQDRHSWDHADTAELAGARALVIGAGDVGAQVTRRLAAFDVDVTSVARRARAGVHAVSELPELLGHADIVVLVVPLTAETTGLVDGAFLAGMADGALLVNAARGPVVDTAALLAELSSGRLRAALDVTDPEPLPADHPLWDAPGLLLTPHVGGAVSGLPRRAYALVRRQLAAYAEGGSLDNVVTDAY